MDTDYLLAVAWMNAYRADSDAAVMIVEQFYVGSIELEQAIGALLRRDLLRRSSTRSFDSK